MIKNKIFIASVGISNLNFNQVLEEIEKYMEHGTWNMEHGEQRRVEPLVIFTPNPEIVVYAQKDQEFRRIVNCAQINIPDGQGIVWASRILGTPIKERVSGTDLLEKLVELAAKKGLAIGLIGGGPGIAVKALECLQLEYPNLQGFSIDGFEVGSRGEEKEDIKILRYYDIKGRQEKILKGGDVVSLISQFLNFSISPTILFVGLGAPKQEYFINKIAQLLNGSIANNLTMKQFSNGPLVLMAVGGAFDYLSGQVPRAPLIIRKIGFEWLFRLLRQPWRLKRQLALLKFIFLVLKQKFVS